LALGVIGVLVYMNSLHNPFVFDDVGSIIENPNVRRLWPPSESLTGPPGSGSNGRPVVAISLSVNYALGGIDVLGFHLFNVGAHVLAAWALFAVVFRTLVGARIPRRLASRALPLAFTIALLWLLHPLHTSALNHVVYRNEVLASLFYLLTLYATIRGATADRARLWYAFAVVACFMGMASKEMMATVPVVVFLYDSIFLAASWRGAWRERRGLYVGLASSWVLLGALVASSDRGASVGFDVEHVTALDYARTQLEVVPHYLRLAFWPNPLVLDYRWRVVRSFSDVVVPAVAVLVLLGAVLWALRRRPMLGFLGAWFFLILAPTSTVIPLTGAVAAEHRMYLPLAALLTVVVVGAAAVLPSSGQGRARGPAGPAALLLAGVLGVAAATALAVLTVRRNHDYRSTEAIWLDVVTKRPRNAHAHDNLGTWYASAGRLDEAKRYFDAALRIDPRHGGAHNNLGSLFVRSGQIDAAMRHFQAALRSEQNLPKVYSNLGSLLTRQGRLDEAAVHIREALRLDPGYGMAHYNMGHLYLARGLVDSAIVRFAVAAERAPHFAEAEHNLAAAYLGKADYARALVHYRATLAIEPDHGGALNNLAWVLATAPDPAVRNGDEAVRALQARLEERLRLYTARQPYRMRRLREPERASRADPD
jgi:tetratricopeptide (TPR) repeat protein